FLSIIGAMDCATARTGRDSESYSRVQISARALRSDSERNVYKDSIRLSFEDRLVRSSID
ncbi:MAG: hypothetical protein ACKO96_22295, partial [Flammeovirgaceae bacterium]